MNESSKSMLLAAFVSLAAGCLAPSAQGAKLVGLRVVDESHVMIHWLDGEVKWKDDGKGPGAFMGHEAAGGDEVIRYQPELNLQAAASAGSYSVRSTGDSRFSAGLRPVKAMRRTKVNGVPHIWPEPPFTLEHIVFLQLPHAMQEGKTYTFTLGAGLNSDKLSASLTFDSTKSETEAIKVGLEGGTTGFSSIKSADLYMWMGDGGARDYSAYVGRTVTAVNQETGAKIPVGKVSFHKPSGPDYGGRNFTQSPVWTCDYSALQTPGRYRLSIPGIGASKDFVVKKNGYRDPFAMSVVGFYYMRIGEDMAMSPPPRQPRFIPGKDPEGFTVYRTIYGPFHPDWKVGGGDKWDTKDWAKYREPGSPTNPNAYGGHSDAADWDRHMGHISIIYDMLLPVLLSNGKLSDDKLGIKESGNGLPDVIEEAQNEVDFWLRLRDGEGNYSCGLNNPTDDRKVMYQAQAHPVMAWANAANAAMLADAWRVTGHKDLAAKYTKEAVEAWTRAKNQALDVGFGVGDGFVRGRDLKMLAAACLYNLTGDRKYEDVVVQESNAARADGWLDEKEKSCQFWAAAAYLMAEKHKWQPIHHPQAAAQMKALALKEAMEKNVKPSTERPTRRASSEDHSWFPSGQHVQVALLAHATAEKKEDREALLKALVLEADYGLGRNPLGVILMTGYGKRGVDDIYTSGRNDGVPGVHPGHTPYINSEPWGQGYMADPKWMANKGYPAWEKWPHGEALWNARYCYANNEFTPQQTMRGKTALLGYLAALELGA